MNKLFKFLTDKNMRTLYWNSKGLYNRLDDEKYLKKIFEACVGYPLNLDNPRTFNEKIQWLKLYDRKQEYTTMVDKYAVKDYVASVIGEEYIIPALGVWDSFEEIDFDMLPNSFVLKCTHDSGGVVICKDKSKFDYEKARETLNHFMKRNYYMVWREWPYKDVKHRILAETYMEDSESHELTDYKFFAFNGKVKSLFIATDRFSQEETKFDFFDENFNHLPMTNGHPNSTIPIKKPQNFELMKTLAEKLSLGIPHVRVDFYEVNGKVYFGELTFSHWSGLVKFDPPEWDEKFGEWIELPKKK